jgi:hypothetical protein
MKREHSEGPKAKEKFERAMIALFRVTLCVKYIVLRSSLDLRSLPWYDTCQVRVSMLLSRLSASS